MSADGAAPRRDRGPRPPHHSTGTAVDVHVRTDADRARIVHDLEMARQIMRQRAERDENGEPIMSENEQQTAPGWYRTLSEVAEGVGRVVQPEEMQGIVSEALVYVDTLREQRDGYKRVADKSALAAADRALAAERDRGAMPEWYRTLSEAVHEADHGTSTDDWTGEGITLVVDAVREALRYVDDLRRRVRQFEGDVDDHAHLMNHWVPVEMPWESVQPGDVILAPPTGGAPAGTPHMILRATGPGTNPVWVQAVGGGEHESRNAKRSPEKLVTVLYPFEMAQAVGLVRDGLDREVLG